MQIPETLPPGDQACALADGRDPVSPIPAPGTANQVPCRSRRTLLSPRALLRTAAALCVWGLGLASEGVAQTATVEAVNSQVEMVAAETTIAANLPQTVAVEVVRLATSSGVTRLDLAWPSPTVTYGPGQPTGWLTVSMGVGTLTPGRPILAAFSLQGSFRLPRGEYTATVTWAYPATSVTFRNPATTVVLGLPFTVTKQVRLTVAGSSLEAIAVPEVALEGTVGGPAVFRSNVPVLTMPVPGTQCVSLVGSAPTGSFARRIIYDPGQPTGWLSVGDVSGSLLRQYCPSNDGAATVVATPGSLLPGVYTGRIEIDVEESNVRSLQAGTSAGIPDLPLTLQIPVRFTIPGPRALGLSSNGATVAFESVAGGPTPATQSVTVTSTIPSLPLTELSVGAVDYSGNGSGWLEATLDGTATPALLALRATPGALAPGEYTASVPISAPNATNTPVLQEVRFTVNPPLVTVTTADLPPATVGAAYAATLAATGGTGTFVWSLSSGALPDGLTLDAGTGGISGVPTTVGSNDITVRAASGSGFGERSLTLTVEPATLSITTPTLPPGAQGVLYGATLEAAGGSGSYDWSLQAGELPAGLILDPTGGIAGTPTAAGTASFTVRVTSGSQTADQALTLLINPSMTETQAVVLALREATYSALTFNGLGGPLALQTIAITSDNGQPLVGLTVDAPEYSGGAAGWLTSTLTPGATPTLQLRPNSTGLGTGTYRATVTVSATGATSAQATITLVVYDGGDALAALRNPARLPEAERRALDAAGNANGVYDLADFVALVRRILRGPVTTAQLAAFLLGESAVVPAAR